MPDEYEIVAVNRAHGFALTRSGALLIVTTWIDEDGDESGHEDAVGGVAQRPDGRWACIDLNDFVETKAH